MRFIDAPMRRGLTVAGSVVITAPNENWRTSPHHDSQELMTEAVGQHHLEFIACTSHWESGRLQVGPPLDGSSEGATDGVSLDPLGAVMCGLSDVTYGSGGRTHRE
jgi:hypothetical protein